jgi:hypothetical protein
MRRKFEILLLAMWAILPVNGKALETRRDAAVMQKSNGAQVAAVPGVTAQTNPSPEMWLQAASRSIKRAGFQQTLFAIPAAAIAVAPNQPPVLPGNTKGIINALCDVPLYVVGCSFAANAAVITCDTNGDAIADLQIALKDVRVVNGNVVYAIIPALPLQLPGTAFPLACCGGTAGLTVMQRVDAGDDNIFQATCPIELGMRAPVILSAVASGRDCAIGQTLHLAGSCFVLPDGKPNVTSVFAVEKDNPNNVVQVTRFEILSDHSIDAYFEFGVANVARRFLIYASGPNGTSRNMTALLQGAPVGCPTGNEQGKEIIFECAPLPHADPSPPVASVFGCVLGRNEAGAFILFVSGFHFKEGATMTIGGIAPKRLKFKSPVFGEPGFFNTIIAKGNLCKGLPGSIVVANPNESPSLPFQCNEICATALSAQEESVDTNQGGALSPPIDIAQINACRLERTEAGVFRLVISGSNIGQNAIVRIGDTVFPKVKFREPDVAYIGRFTRAIVKGRVCRELPGPIVITNPPPHGLPSLLFQCNRACPN